MPNGTPYRTKSRQRLHRLVDIQAGVPLRRWFTFSRVARRGAGQVAMPTDVSPKISNSAVRVIESDLGAGRSTCETAQMLGHGGVEPVGLTIVDELRDSFLDL